ncbi:MAG TPA: hypothetical protein VNM90_28995 [Haliangium sp.]|nr:hypothetical protein [Haliangium sp.]
MRSIFLLWRFLGRALALAPVLAAPLCLAGCPTVDLGDNPPDPGICQPDRGYFEDVIWPQFIAPSNPDDSCVDAPGCHRVNDGRSGFRVSVPTGGEPVDFDGNYDSVVFFLNCSDPSSSRLFTKPLAGVQDHAGGDLFGRGDASAQAFLQWFTP